MSEPTDPSLYSQIKQNIWAKNPVNSAYRSGLLVKNYKKAYMDKYGRTDYYVSPKKNPNGLTRWFEEDWRNQRGEIGYKYKSNVYRPTRRITRATPVTFDELTEAEIGRARREKFKRGRVSRYKK